MRRNKTIILFVFIAIIFSGILIAANRNFHHGLMINNPLTYKLQIIGDSANTALTNQAIDLLKSKAPESLDFVIKYIAIIEIADQGSGMYVWEMPPRCKIGLKTIEAGTIWYSSVLVHEANHSKQYTEYKSKYPSKKVPEEIYSGHDAESECLDVQYKVLKKLGASKETLDYVKNAINTDYWKVDYKNRWW
jgi:hypothetical protein